jgi:hypothetical protein
MIEKPMHKHIPAIVFGFALALTAFQKAHAEQAVVVELYTSQGCSSCPPADAFLGELRTKPGVIALALHVDYWDYIGWADTFGDAKFTNRQHHYAAAEGSKMVYTPQVIVNGQHREIGTNKAAINQAIAQSRKQVSPVAITLVRRGDDLVVVVKTVEDFGLDTTIQLVSYINEAKVEIQHGENAGHEITYYNTVRTWETIGRWSGEAPFEVTVDADPQKEWVVIVQAAKFGEILGAEVLR